MQVSKQALYILVEGEDKNNWGQSKINVIIFAEE